LKAGLAWFLLVLLASLAYASVGAPIWSPGDGLPVRAGITGIAFRMRVCTDGDGGMIAVWSDDRSSVMRDVYAQRIDKNGNIRWTSNGIAVANTASDETWPVVVSDGYGGAIIAWLVRSASSGPSGIQAARIGGDGRFYWPWPSYVGVVPEGYNCENLEIAADGMGGVVLIWDEENGIRPSPKRDIYAQRINADGTLLWGAGTYGVTVCAQTNDQEDPDLITYKIGSSIETIAVWRDQQSDDGNIFAQKLDSAGTRLWGAPGIKVCTVTGTQMHACLVPDGAGGAFVAWEDYRAGVDKSDVFCLRINSAGSVYSGWTTNGIAACSASPPRFAPRMISDEAGGALLVWSDARDIASGKVAVYLQRVGGSGALQFGSGGAQVCDKGTAAFFAMDPGVIYPSYSPMILESDGVIVAWTDLRNKASITLSDLTITTVVGTLPADVYAQKLSLTDGSKMWISGGVPLCTQPNFQGLCELVHGSGAVGGWMDFRGATVGEIYAQKVDTINSLSASITPSSGGYNTVATLSASSSFGSSPVGIADTTMAYGSANNYISFDTTTIATGQVISWNNNSITIKLPTLEAGPKAVRVAAWGQQSNTMTFLYTSGNGPNISGISFNDKGYAEDDYVTPNFTIKARVESPLGFDIGGIYLKVDTRDPIEIPLSYYSTVTKTFTYPHPDELLEGSHNIELYAKDVYNNYSSTSSLKIKVGGEAALVPTVSGVLSGTSAVAIAYTVPSACRIAMTIYSPDGAAIWGSGDISATAGYNEITWDGTGAGARVGAGIYPFKMFKNGVFKSKGYIVVAP